MNAAGGKLIKIVIIAVIAFFLLTTALFTVDERHNAIIFQLGEIRDIIKEPGLHVKVPFLQNVRQFDARIQTIETPHPERFITSEKKNMLVDLYVKWRVVDPELFYKSVIGDQAKAAERLLQTANSNMREEFGRHTVHQVISSQRDQIMENMRKKSDADVKNMGVQIMDVRLKRVDFPDEVSESVYRRMEAERKRVANELRSQGAAEAERIRADADRQRDVIIAEAYRDAEKIKGEGDAKASAIYAEAFGKNPEFFAFYRSLQAYQNMFQPGRDVLIIDGNADFFKYMHAPDKK